MRKYYSLGLTGYPLHHSLSPRIHSAALRHLGLQGDYQLYPVEDTGDLQELLNLMNEGNLRGLNVTIPYKRSIIPLLDQLTAAAKMIGAVNTIYSRDEQIIGDNTDAAGFLADLDQLGWSQENGGVKAALVMGAGGSAQAVVYALAQAGWRITIAARRQEQAQGLVETTQAWLEGESTLEEKLLVPIHLDRDSLSESYPVPDLIVNTTPLGMFPQQDESIWPSDLDFPPGAAIYDLVYNPAESALIKAAKAKGLNAANGLGMLVEQAALSFEIWTGMEAPREVMRQAVQEYQVEI